MRSSKMGYRTINMLFGDDLPSVDDLAGNVTRTMEGRSIIIDLGGATDPEGSASLPVITTLPLHGRLYQVVEVPPAAGSSEGPSYRMGEAISAPFSPWEVLEPYSQWVSYVALSSDTGTGGGGGDGDGSGGEGGGDGEEGEEAGGAFSSSLSYGSSYGTAKKSWSLLDLIGPPESCTNREEGTLCTSGCASTTYCPSSKMGVLQTDAPANPSPTHPACHDEHPKDGYCDEYFDLSFDTPVRPTKVEIFDAYGGGATVAVEAFNPYTDDFDEVWASDEYVTSEMYKVRARPLSPSSSLLNLSSSVDKSYPCPPTHVNPPPPPPPHTHPHTPTHTPHPSGHERVGAEGGAPLRRGQCVRPAIRRDVPRMQRDRGRLRGPAGRIQRRGDASARADDM